MDDVISRVTTVERAKELKRRAIETFEDATFKLHRWQSSEPKSEGQPILPVDKVGNFCKATTGNLFALGISLPFFAQ